MGKSNKRYPDSDGRIYIFERIKCRESYLRYRKNYLGPINVLSHLAEETGIKEETLHNYLRQEGTAGVTTPAVKNGMPRIKSLGRVLEGNEYAFLTLAENGLKTERKNRVAQKEDLVLTGPWSAEIQEVFAMIWEFFSLYQITSGFNFHPDTGKLEGAEEYFSERFSGICNRAQTLFLGRSHLPAFQRLDRILQETEVFLKSYEIPGVVPRWREINRRIEYFDFKYDLVEDHPENYQQLQKEGFVSERPTKLDLTMRKLYFTCRDLSEEELFEEELLDTLIKVFRNDFST